MKYNHAIRRSESSIEIQAPCYWYVVTIQRLADSTEIYVQYTAQEDLLLDLLQCSAGK